MYKIEGPEDGGTPPGPNFGLIVALAGVVIVIGFVIAYFLAPGLARHIHAVHPDKHPTSRLVMPAVGGRLSV